MDRTPRTLLEAVTFFTDADRDHAYAVAARWRNGVACPRHGLRLSVRPGASEAPQARFKECKRDFTAKVGTIFEDSPISFSKWLPAMWLLANTKNGTSSHELGRALGVTQKTAWFMLHRVRESMKDENPPMLTGEVEADETFVGSKHQHLPTRMNAVWEKLPRRWTCRR